MEINVCVCVCAKGSAEAMATLLLFNSSRHIPKCHQAESCQLIVCECDITLLFHFHFFLTRRSDHVFLSWWSMTPDGFNWSGLRPYWEIPCCAMGAAFACLRGPHVVIVVAAFNLCKFLTEMGATGGLSLVLRRRRASGFNQDVSAQSDHAYWGLNRGCS